jgi:hypothetical protein
MISPEQQPYPKWFFITDGCGYSKWKSYCYHVSPTEYTYEVWYNRSLRRWDLKDTGKTYATRANAMRAAERLTAKWLKNSKKMVELH